MGVNSNQYLQGINQTTGTGAPVHSAVAGDRYTDTATGITYQYTTSWQTVSYSAGSLTYFTEAQNTASPNATVPVDSLTAVTGTTDGDFAVIPKGAGAILAQIPDSTTAGGNKRGARAVDFQRSRTLSSQVASGTDSAILSGINNVASSTYSVVLGGSGNTSSANYTLTFGRNATASGNYAFDFSNNGGATADGGFSFLSASTASNATSFNGTATGTGSFAKNGTASGANAFVAGGTANSASGTNSFAANDTNSASGKYSACFGTYGSTKGIASRISLGALQDISPYLQGNSQVSTGVVTTQTTTNTAISLLVYNGTAIALPLQNNEAIRVKGSIIGKQTATTNVTCYDFDCVIVRGTTAASTVIKINNMNLVFDDIVCTVLPTLNADTTNGGLDIKSGGKLTTTIKWTALIDSTESILA
jgi:hypothetical protein